MFHAKRRVKLTPLDVLQILSTVLIASSFVLSWLLDEIAPLVIQYPAILTYGSIVTYVASSYFLQQQQIPLIPVVGEWITLWATISGAAAITIPVELLSHVLVSLGTCVPRISLTMWTYSDF